MSSLEKYQYPNVSCDKQNICQNNNNEKKNQILLTDYLLNQLARETNYATIKFI